MATVDDYKSDTDILDEVLEAEQQFFEAVEDAASGHIPIVIAKGPPGVGKSFGVNAICTATGVESIDLIGSEFQERDEGGYPYNCVNLRRVPGAVRRGSDYATWALVADLYGNREGGVINMEDNDRVLKDDVFVGLLMQATELTARRPIAYAKAQSTHELQFRGVESTFDFAGSIIITTNIKMLEAVQKARQEQEKSNGRRNPPAYIERWAALMSRGSYVDLQMNSPRSVRVYCENKIASTKMLMQSAYLLSNFGRCLTQEENDTAVKWLRHHQRDLQIPLDLRTYNKLAGIMIHRADTWEKSARVRLLNRGV